MISKNLISVAVIAALGTSSAFASGNKSNKSKAEKAVAGEFIVKMKSNVSAMGARASLMKSLNTVLGAGSISKVEGFKTDEQMARIKIKNAAKADEALAALSANPAVEYAEPNYVVHALGAGTPNDPDFSKTWGLGNTGQADSGGQVGTAGADINVIPVWARGLTGSRDVVVAVIDTGVDYNHPDLVNNILINKAEIPADGIDNDQNGFVDDVYGWNFATKTNNPMDGNKHGTHCAGTIGAEGDNGVGVAGVNWKVSILPVKFLSDAGSGTTADAIESINYATLRKVNIMSNSWGGGRFSQGLFDAITKAKDAGILFVAAAGNDGSNNDSTDTFPAGYQVDNVLAVAATDNKDALASFSNYGVRKVHVAAPGVKVYSTTPNNTYASFSGTSMATPHAAGVAALVLAANPTMTYLELKNRLITTSAPVASLARKVVAGGRINVLNAMDNIVPPPAPKPDDGAWKDEARVLESEHPYAQNANQVFTVNVPGAKYIRVVFEKYELEAGYDFVLIENAAGEVQGEVSGEGTNFESDYVAGETLNLRLKTDSSVDGYGFKVAKIQWQ